ncbi:unnamed protein product [marine sediment metagenome]|uniref:Uncharacterized protein n=1 Tax=marine sediment metagenome TaxID=412755 RepID=X1HAC8_9ZZZZ
MAMRGGIDKSLTSFGPASQSRHVRFGPGFIEEYEPVRIESALRFDPILAGLPYVGSVLLTGV